MKLLVIGATSAIANETTKVFASEGASIFLVGRDPDKLRAIQADLKVRGAKQVETRVLDANDLTHHQELIDQAIQTLDGLDAALIAHGTLGNQAQNQTSVAETLQEFNTNCLSYISLLTILANYFEKRKSGCLAVISSVAGDRGRGSNYIYGSAKGAVSIFVSGLRNRLNKVGVSVVTIKPGFVDSPMTAALKKNPLYAKPEVVGQRIHTAMLKGESIVYVPKFWQMIMLIIRSIPESIFKKLSL